MLRTSRVQTSAKTDRPRDCYYRQGSPSFISAAGWVNHALAAQRGAARPQIRQPEGPVWQVIRKLAPAATVLMTMRSMPWIVTDCTRSSIRSAKAARSKSPARIGNPSRLARFQIWSYRTAVSALVCAPEISTFLTDLEATRLMSRSCESCHDLQVVNRARFSADRWRVILVTMRERCRVLDEELEQMVDSSEE